MQTVIKRDGREVPFDDSRITEAIRKAGASTGELDASETLVVTSEVLKRIGKFEKLSVEEIQDVVEHVLMDCGFNRTAKAYILYRAERTRIREGRSDLMETVADIIKETSRENANIGNSPSAKMLQIASAASRQFYLTKLIPQDFAELHRNGDIHIHDLDFYGKTLTCIQISLGQLLAEGFNNGHGYIRPPARPGSASALAAIILQSSQNDMHGGQSFAFFDRDMAPYMENADDYSVYQAMEALIYNLNSMHSRAGAQVPFSSINLGTDTSTGGRKTTENLLKAFRAGLGRGETPIFPNIIFRLKKGINMEPGDPNYDLFRLACTVASERLNPTFCFMDSSFNKQYGTEVAAMGCRTRVIANRHGPAVTDRRGNLSFTTVNLPRLAIKANGNESKFWLLLEDIMYKAAAQLYHRYQVQAKLRVCDMPFLMGQKLYMGSDQLKPEDCIEPAIKHGTLAIGFIGLAETLKRLVGKHHGEDASTQELGEQIVKFMRERTDEAADRYDLNYTFLATPAEGLSGRFVSIDRKLFGVIPGVTDKEYYTNSYHVPVDYEISCFDKIRIEGVYHKYCNAGHITYVELPSPPRHNIAVVEAIVKAMAEADVGYGGINYPTDFCDNCALQGVIIHNECPVCGSTNIRRIRRITGYLSTVDRFNDAKRAELKQRRIHSI